MTNQEFAKRYERVINRVIDTKYHGSVTPVQMVAIIEELKAERENAIMLQDLETLQKAETLYNAMKDLNEHWNYSLLDMNYPFHENFGDLTLSVRDWLRNMKGAVLND